MPRRARVIVPGIPVHLIQRGHNRDPVFFSDDDYWKYLHDLRTAAEQHGCLVHAYVLMTNHVHIITTPLKANSLAYMMKSIGSRYVRYINGKYKRSGTLWESRFKSALINTEQYLLTCYRYVELNPVRARMVADPKQYPWSSFHHNALGKRNKLVTNHEIYQGLGKKPEDRQAAYLELFKHQIPNSDLSYICKATQQNSIMGNDRFRKRIEKMLGRKLMVDSHGGNRRGSAKPKPPSP